MVILQYLIFRNFSLQISPLCYKTSQGEISKNLARNFLGESCLVTWEVFRSEVPSVQFPLSKVFVPSSCQSVSYFSKTLFNLLPFKWIKQQVANFNDALSFPKYLDNVNVVGLWDFLGLVYTHFLCVVYLVSYVDMIVTLATNRKKVKENGDISLYFRPLCVLICPPCVPMCSPVCPGNSCVLVWRAFVSALLWVLPPCVISTAGLWQPEDTMGHITLSGYKSPPQNDTDLLFKIKPPPRKHVIAW